MKPIKGKGSIAVVKKGKATRRFRGKSRTVCHWDHQGLRKRVH
ncbi:hypothetical protein ACFOUO_03160 [Salinithrix halophila]|uniref:50S ribosomal protein L35 n=1 Tax=Salinithrix halophila TaxID=1485204 RepID=A0ABV8JDH7_9BACL